MNLQRITVPHDKANHLIFGFGVAFVAAALAAWAGRPSIAGPLAVTAATVVGGLKELVDHAANQAAAAAGQQEPHTVDPADVLATGLGGAAFWLAIAMV